MFDCNVPTQVIYVSIGNQHYFCTNLCLYFILVISFSKHCELYIGSEFYQRFKFRISFSVFPATFHSCIYLNNAFSWFKGSESMQQDAAHSSLIQILCLRLHLQKFQALQHLVLICFVKKRNIFVQNVFLCCKV